MANSGEEANNISILLFIPIENITIKGGKKNYSRKIKPQWNFQNLRQILTACEKEENGFQWMTSRSRPEKTKQPLFQVIC